MWKEEEEAPPYIRPTDRCYKDKVPLRIRSCRNDNQVRVMKSCKKQFSYHIESILSLGWKLTFCKQQKDTRENK